MIDTTKTQKGSALIIALLIMGVLMTLALGLSDLVIREVRITQDVINSGKAYYAAEAGMESALLDLHQRLPGYETVDKENWFEPEIGLTKPEPELLYTYSVDNRTKTIPHVDTSVISPYVAEGAPERYLFNKLELNEQVVLPLFTSEAEGIGTNDVTAFRVEYYIDAAIAPRWQANYGLNNVDVLRWKITGIKTEGIPAEAGELPKLLTESIGDYIAVLPNSDPKNPTCFGNSLAYPKAQDVGGISYSGDCQESQYGKIYDIARNAYVLEITIDPDTGDPVVATKAYIENPTNPGENPPMKIDQFINEHSHNYLTISNIFNPSVLENPNDSQIYYRIIIPKEGEYTIRDFAKITSTGLVRNLRQHIEAYIAPDRFMPVFNFSLYRTDVRGDEDKETPDGYL
ncbi:PilX N-terminal domain-containing pilus assembly protein [Patescibacteria group bacterium]